MLRIGRWTLMAPVAAAAILVGGGTAHADVYWINGGASPQTIGTAANDGTGVNQSLITAVAGEPYLTGIAANSTSLFYSALVNGSNEGRLNKTALSGGTATALTTRPMPILGLTATGSRVWWDTYDPFGSPVNPIGTAATDGTGVDPALLTTIGGQVTAVDDTYIYWSNANDPNGSLGSQHSIGRAKLDGTAADQNFITTDSSALGLVVHGGYIYWSNTGDIDPSGGAIPVPGTTIGRANVDGTGVQQSFITGANEPQGLGTDGTYLYWSNTLGNTIGRAALDGTGVQQSFITGTNAPGPLAVSPSAPVSGLTVDSLADSGVGSLREAIKTANAAGGGTISFAVAGTIELASALPDITSPITIDGTTAPGYVAGGAPVVRVENKGARGLLFAAGSEGSSLRGLSLTGAGGSAVTIRAPRVTVVDNYIGVTPEGVAAANSGDGVALELGSDGSTVGENAAGVSGAVSNVISGNGGSGIRIAGSNDNVVQDNYIGTSPSGAEAMGNGGDGILITDGAKRNLIGGRVFTDSATGQTNNPTGSKGTVTPVFVVPPLGNLVSGNTDQGIAIRKRSSDNVLNGNFVGTMAGGDEALGNGGNGVLIKNSDNTLLQGCKFRNEPFVYYNVLSGNKRNGLQIVDSDGTVVQANFLGVGADNTTPLGNGRSGLVVAGDSADTQVGGVIPLGNVIAGNKRNGIEVKGTAQGFTSFNTFAGLLAFKGAAANGSNGILITSTGGDNLLRTNVVSGNRRDGVKLAGKATGVTIDPNIIGLNTRGDGTLPNGGSGIVVTDKAHHNVIGGTRASVIRQNTVSGNRKYGLVLEGTAHHNKVFNTYIGSNIQGVHKGRALPRVGNRKGGVLVTGKAHDNTLGRGGSAKRYNKLISGNEGPGVTMDSATKGNTVVRNYIGVGRHGRCLVNRGANVIDKGANTVARNLMCSVNQRDGARPSRSVNGLG